MYFERFIEKIKGKCALDKQAFLLYFILCIVISCKMNEDLKFENRFYIEQFKLQHIIQVSDFNKSEIIVLKKLKYSLFISEDGFNKFIEQNSKSLEIKIQEGIKRNKERRRKIFKKIQENENSIIF
jgi:hypothetical protein